MRNTKPIQIAKDHHLALKLMTAEPAEKRDMHVIIEQSLDKDEDFKKFIVKARKKLKEVEA